MIHALLLAAVVASPLASSLPTIPIGGTLVRSDATLDAAAWLRLPHTTLKAAGHDKTVGIYDGIRLADLIHDAGAPVGDAVHGKAARAYVVVSASDGYSAVFAPAELDTAEPRCAPIIADSRDGMALSSEVGPVSIVAPCDLTHARWVRGVSKLTVVVASDT